MARFTPDKDALALGAALGELRRARGLSQAEAGAGCGLTSQGWGLYEAGRRQGLYRPDVQRRLTAALDATPEDLALAAARLAPEGPEAPAEGVQAPARVFAPAPQTPVMRTAPRRERLRLSSDDLAPWAASGVVLEYEVGRWPRRGQGCVVRLADGTLRVRLFDSADGERLVLAAAADGSRLETLPRGGVREVSAVTARLDAE